MLGRREHPKQDEDVCGIRKRAYSRYEQRLYYFPILHPVPRSSSHLARIEREPGDVNSIVSPPLSERAQVPAADLGRSRRCVH